MRFLIRSESALAGQIKGYLREGMRMVMTGPIDPSGVYFGFCSTRDCSSPTESTLPATSAYVDFDAGGNFTISLNDGGMVDSSEIVLIIEGVGSRGEIKYRIDNVLGSCYTDSLHN